MQGRPEPWYTPITPDAKQFLGKAWREFELPATDFDHWSLEFAREIFEVIAMYKQSWCVEAVALRGFEPAEELTVVLDQLGVFGDDKTVHQWVPEGWKPAWQW